MVLLWTKFVNICGVAVFFMIKLAEKKSLAVLGTKSQKIVASAMRSRPDRREGDPASLMAF